MDEYINKIEKIKNVLDVNHKGITKIEEQYISSIKECNKERERKNEDINSVISILNNKLERERNESKSDILDTLNKLDEKLKSIEYKSFKRRKDEILATKGSNIDYSDMDLESLKKELERKRSEFNKVVVDLENSFIPIKVSNLLSSSILVSRNKKFEKIAMLRRDIIEICYVINKKSKHKEDIKKYKEKIFDKKNEIESVSKFKQDSAVNICRKKIEDFNEKYNEILKIKDREGLFDENTGIEIGSLISMWDSKMCGEFKVESFKKLDEKHIYHNLFTSKLDTSFIFEKDNSTKVNNYITNVISDLLVEDKNCLVYLLDLKGIGSNYESLYPFITSKENFKILRTEDELKNGLDEIERNVLNNKEGYKNIYIFSDDLEKNLTEKTYEKFTNLLINGKAFHIFSFLFINRDEIKEKWFLRLYEKLSSWIMKYSIKGNKIYLTDKIYIYLLNTINKEKLETNLSLLKKELIVSSVIPIEKALPTKESWGKGSSKYGIRLPIGQNEKGKILEFVLTEDKPYGLIVGDVDSGKSSLLHTLILQTSTYYSPEEVKISIGDFKNGAEFNIYAEKNQKNIEAVLSNEDPYAINSFLKRYVAELSFRQNAFDDLEEETGKLIRKYETYREVYENYGCSNSYMLPRLIIFIDEYQAVFDNNSDSAKLLINLIRKGRTYGIHIIMASQRAISDDPRNGFTTELKNMFTSRFVFRSPQQASRMVLNEKCSDTGKENSGIAKASLLKKGQAIYNSYLGQNEKDNEIVQIFYPKSSVIEKICDVQSRLYKGDLPVLLKENANSRKGYLMKDSITLGDSLGLFVDSYSKLCDIKDYTNVYVRENERNNILVVGSRYTNISVISSTIKYALSNGKKVNIFSNEKNEILKYLGEVSDKRINVITNPLEMIHVIKNQKDDKENYVNIFLNISTIDEFKQFGIKKSEGQGVLIDSLNINKDLFIFIENKYSDIKSEVAFLLDKINFRIIGAGNFSNLKGLMPDSFKYYESSFDIESEQKINAYYVNKELDRFGKVVLFLP